jgi:hypothetical protein
MKVTSLAPLSLLVLLACAGKTIEVGSAANGTQSAAPAVPLAPPVTIVLGGDTYQPPLCGAGGGFSDANWSGPTFAASTNPGCEWPATNPALRIDVLLRGFLTSAGFPAGTYDLADPKLADLAVNFETASQAESPVGGPERPSVTYSSAAAACDFGANGPLAPAPGVTGKVTVGRYQTGTSASGAAWTAYDVTLADVVLAICGPGAEDFPQTVSIPYAHLANTR